MGPGQIDRSSPGSTVGPSGAAYLTICLALMPSDRLTGHRSAIPDALPRPRGQAPPLLRMKGIPHTQARVFSDKTGGTRSSYR